MSLPFLTHFGLSDTESALYELLLKLGQSPAWVIVRDSKMKRPTVYKALANLQKKGLVTAKDKGKIIHFTPAPPTDLLTMADQHYQNLQRARNDLQTMLPALLSSYTMAVEKPVVRTFEGVEGVKKAHLELLALKQPIAAYVTVNDEIDDQLGDFWKKYYAIRKRDNIFARVLSPDTKGAKGYQKLDSKELRETRLIPEQSFPSTIEKDIVGDKVAFFSIHNGNLLATIIDNKPIADTERAIFELAWEKAL